MLTQRYVDLLTQAGLEARRFGLSSAIYTAATDVENEVDGLVTYDRQIVKADGARVRAVNRAVIAAGSRAPRRFGTFSSLAAAYDNVGITDAATPIPGNYDGGGQSYDAAGLASAGLAPGQTVTIDGVPVTWPAIAAGRPDNVVTGGQTIRIHGAGHTLVLLGAGTWAPVNETATGKITYSDGSSRSYQLSFNDWTAATASTNSQIVTTSPSNVEPGSAAAPLPFTCTPTPSRFAPARRSGRSRSRASMTASSARRTRRSTSSRSASAEQRHRRRAGVSGANRRSARLTCARAPPMRSQRRAGRP